MLLAVGFLITRGYTRPFTNFRIHEFASRRFWDERGRLDPNFVLPRRLNSKGGGKETWEVVVSGVRTRNELPNVYFRFGKGLTPGITKIVSQGNSPKEWYALQSIRANETLKEAPISVGVGYGRWNRVARWDPGSGKTTGVRFAPKFVPRFGPKHFNGPNECTAEVLIPANLKSQSWRVVGFDLSGKEIRGGTFQKLSHDQVLVQEGLSTKRSNVGRVELQVRPIIWTSLGRVPLNPRK